MSRVRSPSPGELERLRDVEVFAGRLVGEPLWPHQVEVARSPARFRMVCAGRQVGKSRTLAVIALHAAFTTAGYRVLVVSAGEDASKDLMAEISALASSEWLGGSVADDDSTKIVLSNGSTIRCIPASQRRARGKSIDLLILDEAAFIDQTLWDAAKFTILARAGSRVVLSSTPYGRRDRFFAQYWRLGMDAPAGDAMYAAWHWPSVISPLVDRALIEEWRRTDAPRVFAAEVEAVWPDEAGAYFTAAELEAATKGFALVPPARGGELGTVVGGVDWGFAVDASALAVVAAHGEPTAAGEARFWVPWVEERFGLPYGDWIEYVVGAARGFAFSAVACETNGVGAMPSQVLARRVFEEFGRSDLVVPVHTDNRVKEDAFGFLKLLMQRDRLWLPRHPGLLRQLSALEFDTSERGLVRISVPERAGHDDLAMSLALAAVPLAAEESFAPPEVVVDFDDLDEDLERYSIGPSGVLNF